ncbi:MAG TPA: hypothetical protein VN366_03535 [Feifaniaceae bacterium]|nr:hypothetical protein [Feifaniaceae bacterium]
MDWLVVILVVAALAMIGVVSLLHRGRVRIWSICMILLGLGIGILLYTRISIFKNWQSALYVVGFVVLALVLVYLFVALSTRRQQKGAKAKAEKDPGESDVLATASREPMRLSEWEAVISYSAAPAKAGKEIHRVNANAPQEDPAPVPFASMAFTPAPPADESDPEQGERAADAITSFFREGTPLPPSAIRMKSAVRPRAGVKPEERKPYSEPLRVSSVLKPAAEPITEKQKDEAFESLSFRVVRDKLDPQKKPEPATEPKSSVAKDAPAAEKQKNAPSPLSKVHKKTSPVPAEQILDAFLSAREQAEASSPALSAPDPDAARETAVSDVPAQPEIERSAPAPSAEEITLPAAKEPWEAISQWIAAEEPPAEILPEEPQEAAVLPAAAEWAEEPAPATQEQPAVEEPAAVAEVFEHVMEPESAEEAVTAEEEVELVTKPKPAEGTGPVEEIELAAAPEPAEEADALEEAGSVREGVPPAAAELPALDLPEPEPAPPAAEEPGQQNDAEALFEAGMARLTALAAAKEYRSAQALIFDLLRMDYEPTEEEKRRLLLVMKLLKEKEKTNADARSR